MKIQVKSKSLSKINKNYLNNTEIFTTVHRPTDEDGMEMSHKDQSITHERNMNSYFYGDEYGD